MSWTRRFVYGGIVVIVSAVSYGIGARQGVNGILDLPKPVVRHMWEEHNEDVAAEPPETVSLADLFGGGLETDRGGVKERHPFEELLSDIEGEPIDIEDPADDAELAGGDTLRERLDDDTFPDDDEGEDEDDDEVTPA